MTNQNSQNPKQSHSNDELERAMLIDRVARLERELETAEGRARDAEQSAKEAKSTLAGTLLAKARDQKSGNASNEKTVKRPTQEDKTDVPDTVADAKRALRAEYEEKFQAARDRMAREFQERLIEAQSSWKAETMRRVSEVRQSTSDRAPSRDLPKVVVLPGNRGNASRPISRVTSEPHRHNAFLGSRAAIFFAVALAVGAGILLAKGMFQATKIPSPPPPAATARATPAVTAAVPHPVAAPAVTATAAAPAATPAKPPADATPAEPAPPPATDTQARTPPTTQVDDTPPTGRVAAAPSAKRPDKATSADTLVSAPPASAVKAAASDVAPGAGKTAEAETAFAQKTIAAQDKLLEQDAALTAEVDALRKRLDTEKQRAQSAEAAARRARKKAAEAETRRVAAEDAAKRSRQALKALTSGDNPSPKSRRDASPFGSLASPSVDSVE